MSENPASSLEAATPEAPGADGTPPQVSVRPARFEPLPASAPQAGVDPTSIDMLMEVPLRVAVELGRARMSVRQVLELRSGSVVQLDRMAGDPADILVNDRLMARGDVVVVDDKFGIRITELVMSGRREGE